MSVYHLLAILTDPLSLLLLVGMGGALIGLLVAHWLRDKPAPRPRVPRAPRAPLQLRDYKERVARFNEDSQ